MAGQEMEGLMGAGAMPAGDPAAQPPQDGMPDPTQGTGPQQDQPGAPVDIKPILDGIEVPENLKPMYDKIVLSGMRIMFSKESHKLFVDELQKEGPLAEKIAKGITGLMYLVWNQSNKSLPPQLIIPATVALTVRAFDYVQKTGDPEASKEVLGQAIQGSLEGVMNGFGSKLDDLQQTLEQSKQGMQTAASAGQAMQQGQPMPQGGGLMDAAGGQNG